MFLTDRSKKALGISVGEHSLLVAQVASEGVAPQVMRVAEFTYPEGITLENPEALGAALKEFLKASGFSARRTIIGVPAKWLVVRPHQIPPTDPKTAIDLLSIQVESHPVPELGEIIYDFVGESSETEATTALVMGLPHRWLGRLTAMAATARLQVAGITPCTAALAAATALNTQRSIVLSIRNEGAEIAAVDGLQTRFLRHLSSAVSTPPLSTELRRSMAMLPAGFASNNGHSDSSAEAGWMVLWDDVGLDQATLAGLQQSLGMSLVRGDLTTLGGRGCGLTDGRVGARAIALALPLLQSKRPAVDFLHPKLVPTKPAHASRRGFWISIAGAAAALAVALGYVDLVRLQRQVSGLDEQYRLLEPSLQIAKPFVNRMRFAETFSASDPSVLACLRDLAVALPPDNRTYLTSFRLQDNMQGEFSGRSDNVQDVISVIDTLNTGSRFCEIKRSFDGRGNTGGVSFKITFLYVPKR